MFGLLEGQGGLRGPLAAILGGEPDGFAFDFTTMYGENRDGGVVTVLDSGDITYTAPSTKWIRNKSGIYESGSTLRTEYGLDGSALGLLIEPAATNYFKNSNDITGTGWEASAGVVREASGYPGPFGSSTTSGKFIPPASAGSHYISNTPILTTTIGTRYMCYFGVHYDEMRYVHIGLSVTAFGTAVRYGFDLSDGSYSAVVTGTNSGAGAFEVLPGFWVVYVYADATEAVTTAAGILYSASSKSTVTYTGDGVVGVEVWHAQFEAGPTLPTSVIKTTSGTVSRSHDDIYVNTGIITAYTNGDPFTVLFGVHDSNQYGGAGSRGRLGTMWGDANNYIYMYPSASVVGEHAAVAKQGGTSWAAGSTLSKMNYPGVFAVAADDNDMSLVGDAYYPSVAQDATFFPPDLLTKLQLGGYPGVGGYGLAGHMSWVAFIPRRMSNAEIGARIGLL